MHISAEETVTTHSISRLAESYFYIAIIMTKTCKDMETNRQLMKYILHFHSVLNYPREMVGLPTCRKSLIG